MLPALVEQEQVNYIRLNYNLAEAFLAIILVTGGLSTIITLIKYMIRNRKKEMKHLKDNGLTASCSALYRFSKTEIDNAINFFPEKKYLWRSSAGQVYTRSGQPVAIKQLYQTNISDSFVREIEGLSRVRHANLVCLFGCCFEDGKQYVVYEYCSKGNLAEHLLRKYGELTWELRVKILRDCAFALKYLHHHVDGCIVHRDIKAKDVNMTRRPLTDFQDPCMNGDIITIDFKSILQIAVLCVANSRSGRPTIIVVCEELDKAYKNKMAEMAARRNKNLIEATPPKSPEVMQV